MVSLSSGLMLQVHKNLFHLVGQNAKEHHPCQPVLILLLHNNLYIQELEWLLLKQQQLVEEMMYVFRPR
jgi:hypothetical protein